MHWAVYVAKEVTRVSNSQFRCVEYIKVMGSEERFGEMKGKCGRRGQRWINIMGLTEGGEAKMRN